MFKASFKYRPYIIPALLFALFFSWVCKVTYTNLEINKDFTVINKGWYVEGEGIQDSVPVDCLEQFKVDYLKKGDSLTFSHTIGKTDIANPMLVFYTNYCLTTIYIDGKEVYKAGQDSIDNNEMIGDIRNEYLLPNDCVGKILAINIVADRDDPMTFMEPVGLLDATDDMNIWFSRPMSLATLGIFLVSVSMIGIVLSFTNASEKASFLQFIFMSIIMFFTGVYLLCRSHMMDILLLTPHDCIWLEFFSLYILPFCISCFIFPVPLYSKDNNLKKLYVLANCIYVIVFMYLLFEDCAGITYLCSNIKKLLLNGLLLDAAVFYVLVIDNSKYNKKPWINKYIQGVITYVLGGALMVVVITTCEISSHHMDTRAFYNLLLIIIIAAVLRFFIIGMKDRVNDIKSNALEAEANKRMAMYDQLTCIGNRRAFKDDCFVNGLDLGQVDYSYINIDLNDLKKINDNIGHNTGDLLLKTFAQILSDTCSEFDVCSCYRVGGDEFLVLVLDSSVVDVFIDSLAGRCNVYNADEHKPFKISYALGSAKSSEAAASSLVYGLADRRMYKDKSLQKQQVL